MLTGLQLPVPTPRMEISTGRIAGLVAIRDDAAVTYQTQLDEMARGLIAVFQESGTAGLFTNGGSSAVPGGPGHGTGRYDQRQQRC